MRGQLAVVLWLAGCQAGAEVGWTIGPLKELLAIGGGSRPESLWISAVLTGWDGQALAPEDRVRSSDGIHRLTGLDRANLRLRNGVLRRGPAVSAVGDTPTAVRHEASPWPLRVVVLLDNSGAAAIADPVLARLASIRSLIKTVTCNDCPLPAEVELLVMQGGRVLPAAEGRLDSALQALATTARGEAPLWDGLVEAVRRAKTHARPGSGAVLCYSAGGGGGPSTATAAGVREAFLGSSVRLLAVQHSGVDSELVALAARTGGGWIPVMRGLDPALQAAGAALAGRWILDWAPAPPSMELQQFEGTLELSFGRERRTAELDLPIPP